MLRTAGVMVLCLAGTYRGFSSTECKDHFPINSISGDGFIRFFHQPDDSNYFHAPVIFRSAEDRSTKVGTAPATEFGRIVYISEQEMRVLEMKISELPISWCLSRKAEDLEASWKLHSHSGMDVKVIFTASTAESQIRTDRICDALASLDPVIKTKRALWEFQLFRIGYHCAVAHFNPDAYPDRLP